MNIKVNFLRDYVFSVLYYGVVNFDQGDGEEAGSL